MRKPFFAATLALELSLFAHADGQETPIGARRIELGRRRCSRRSG